MIETICASTYLLMTGFLIHSAVEYYAQETPEHPALSCQGSEMSYRTLDQRSNQLARALIASGAQAQDRVGIYLYKGLELGVAIYGILKAGCSFVPLDPFLPVDRLAFIVEDCDIRNIVSGDEFIPKLNELAERHTVSCYGIDSDKLENSTAWSAVADYPDEPVEPGLIDLDLAYIMYTSGSTGVPKGMMHTHQGSLAYARWGAQHTSMQATDRVASHAPLHFDLSIFDFFSTAQAGATVVLVPEAVTRFPASWTALLETESISMVFTVPYTLITMLGQGVMEQRDLSALRWILYGGEAFAPGKLRQLMLALPGVRLTNVYGPAEAPSCTCHDISLPEEGDNEALPIGVVSRNSEDIIIDEQGKDCAEGTAGELCIRSATLTRGYWNRPDLDERAFLFRPGYGQFPKVYFRTGDMVVRKSDGLLRFLGRVDRMVKIRGQRVELDEIEAVLTAHKAVFEAAAFVVPHKFDSLQIIAVVTLLAEATEEAFALQRYARGKLSSYAVPQQIEVREQLPHNSSGKIDRKQLAQSWIADNAVEPDT